MELDFHGDLYVHRPAVFERRLKAPLSHSLDRFLVEPEAQAPNYTKVPRMSCGVHDQPEDTSPLLVGSARLFGIAGIGRRERLRRRNTATNFVNTAADAATGPSTGTRSVTYAYAASRTRTY